MGNLVTTATSPFTSQKSKTKPPSQLILAIKAVNRSHAAPEPPRSYKPEPPIRGEAGAKGGAICWLTWDGSSAPALVIDPHCPLPPPPTAFLLPLLLYFSLF